MKTVTVTMQMPEPPAGYEYTGKWRQANDGEPYLDIQGTKDATLNAGGTQGMYPILRRVKPDTVMVELPRAVVEEWGKQIDEPAYGATVATTVRACRAALAKEDAQ